MSEPSETPKHGSTSADEQREEFSKSSSWLGRVHPYFQDPSHVLVLKLDLIVLSWAFVAGLLKDMDQSSATQAYVSGMKQDLSLNGNELVEFTTFFSIGYAIFIIPSQIIQTRVRPSLFLPVCEIVWGILTLVTYRAQSAKAVYALRFFLGVFESTSWPGIVSLLLNWYTPPELGKRLAIFGVSGMAGSMFLGIVQAALYKNLNGAHGLAGWRWLFIVSGVITIVWGIVGFLAIPDSPSTTRALFLSPAEKRLSQVRMADSGTETANLIPGRVLKRKLRLLLASPITYIFLAAYVQFSWAQRSNSYFLLYLKGLKNAQGAAQYSTYTVNLIPLGGYAISIVCNIGLNALSDWKEWRWQIATGAATLHLVATSVLAAWPDSRATILTFYFLSYATAAWGYALLAWLALILRKEPEARAILIAAAVTLTYVGHATIPLRAWRTADSPTYPIGFPLTAAFCAGSIVCLQGIRLYVKKRPYIFDRGLEKSDVRVVVVEDSLPEGVYGPKGVRTKEETREVEP